MMTRKEYIGQKPLHSLIVLEDFKAVLSVDDRDDTLSRYCLVTATYTIEQHCMRRLLRKKYFEHIAFTGDLILLLREYPVTEIVSISREQRAMSKGEETSCFDNCFLIPVHCYRVIPDCGTFDDIPASLVLSPALNRYRKLAAIELMYYAGYAREDVPPDLAIACLELAAWNMNRYKGKLAMNNYQGVKKREGLEMSMPENVRFLLEPYRRKTI